MLIIVLDLSYWNVNQSIITRPKKGEKIDISLVLRTTGKRFYVNCKIMSMEINHHCSQLAIPYFKFQHRNICHVNSILLRNGNIIHISYCLSVECWLIETADFEMCWLFLFFQGWVWRVCAMKVTNKLLWTNGSQERVIRVFQICI